MRGLVWLVKTHQPFCFCIVLSLTLNILDKYPVREALASGRVGWVRVAKAMESRWAILAQGEDALAPLQLDSPARPALVIGSSVGGD